MQSRYPAAFDREMGCTESEWLGWLPGAVREGCLTLAPRSASIAFDAGTLTIGWEPLPDRQIALMRIARMAVRFRFDGVDDEVRQRFMRYFDLYMQRGGG